jgi:glucose-fructose oxidoreductase
LPGLLTAQSEKPVRIAIAGLAHGHVEGFIQAALARKDIVIVGIFESDSALAASIAKRYNRAE